MQLEKANSLEARTVTLDQGTVGESYTVKDIKLPDQVAHRLEALGMTVDTRVSVLENKSRGIMVVKVRGTRFALGRGITGKIEVV